MKKPTFQTKRQRRRKAIRSLYGNPWDSSSSSSRRRSSSSRRSASKTSKRRVTFREPIERSASKTKSSSRSNVWRTVSSEK